MNDCGGVRAEVLLMGGREVCGNADTSVEERQTKAPNRTKRYLIIAALDGDNARVR